MNKLSTIRGGSSIATQNVDIPRTFRSRISQQDMRLKMQREDADEIIVWTRKIKSIEIHEIVND